MKPEISTYTDEKERDFYYSLINNNSEKLVIHFTAFFGDWGDRKEYKENYKGYFHRFKMLSEYQHCNFLFVCDQYGATDNGTYYTGKKGDFFVERATQEIIQKTISDLNIDSNEIITIGSSMGATGALKFGLLNKVKAIITICPHIDLDICAKLQGREAHVAWICPDGNTQSPNNYSYTRQIRNMLNEYTGKPPRLFIHSCMDDHGVHDEQVKPLIQNYLSKGGKVDFYERSYGGHGGDFCGKSVVLDVIEKYFNDQSLCLKGYFKFKHYPDRLKAPIPFIKYHIKRLLKIPYS